MSTFIWGVVAVPNVPNNTLAISGQYISGQSSLIPGSLLAPADVMHFIPFVPGRNLTLDQLAVNVEVAGSAGSLVRLGLYNDSGADLPGGLMVDAGTVATDSTGLKSLPISEALSGGNRYWFAAAQQGAAAIAATYTSIALATGTVTVTNPSSGFNGVLKLGIPGAFPSPANASVALLGSQVMLRTIGRVA